MARVLLITPQSPYPPHQGTALRNFNIIRGLARRHELALLTFNDVSVRPSLDTLRQYCYAVHKSPIGSRSQSKRLVQFFTSSKPDMAHRLHSRDFLNKLANLLAEEKSKRGQEFDIIQIEGLEMASVIPIIREYSPKSLIVLDNHNAEASLQQRTFEADRIIPRRWPMAFYSYVQTIRLREYERWACESSDYVVAVSDEDLSQILLLAPNVRASVIPNSIDIEEYDGRNTGAQIPYDLIFIGKMDYRPNVDAVGWFAMEVWPKILEQRPSTTWAIVGQKPHKKVESLGRSHGAMVTGKVEDVLPYLRGASIVIMPFRMGSGTRLKFIEAAASSRAVVSTSIGVEGFKVSNGKELLISDEPKEFAVNVLTLLNDPAQRQRIGQMARAFSVDFDYRQVNLLFDNIYKNVGIS